MAVALVVGLHANLISSGGLGVDVFFVLSGYLITTLLLREWRTTGTVSLRGFYVRRAARLLPALTLLLAAYLAYGFLTGGIGSHVHLLTAAGAGAGYVTNVLLANGSTVPAHYLWHLWSLAEEEQFYLLWPPILLLALRRRIPTHLVAWSLAVLVCAVAVERLALLAAGAPDQRIWFGADTHSDPILIGCLAALVPLTVGVRIAVSGLGAMAAVLVIAASIPMREAVMLTAFSPLFPVACAAVILHVARNGWLARPLALGPLAYIGRISYGVYLWHFPLMHYAGITVGLVLTALVAPASYRYVETPIRRLAKRRDAKPAAWKAADSEHLAGAEA